MEDNKTVRIATKLVMAISVIASVVMAVLIYLAWKALQNPPNPTLAAINYHTYSSPLFIINCSLFLFNLLFSVYMQAVYQRSMNFVIGLFIFVFFINLDWFWLSEVYFHFTRQYGMWKGGFSATGFFAVIFGFIATILTLVGFIIGSLFYNRKLKKNQNA